MASLAPNQMNDYHKHVPEKGWMRFEGEATSDPYEYSKQVRNGPVFPLFGAQWQKNLDQPFFGVTSDGMKRNDIYHLRGEGVCVSEMVTAARNVIESLSPDEQAKAVQDLDGEAWRRWCNPEVIIHDQGVRLEQLRQPQRDLIMELLRQSLSEKGFAKAQAAIRTNKFLGQLCDRSGLLNEHSYFLTLFGSPSVDEPWGFTFFGHHLALNIFVVGNQMTISPVFIGAEPNVIDSGPDSGTSLCTREESLGLRLIQSLRPELQQQAQIYREMQDPAMPEGRWNPADQRHLGGAFQDNRVIPYEGVLATELTDEQRSILMSLVEAFLELLPEKPLRFRLREIEKFLPETYFCWIGGFGDEDPFYFRIQSPVVFLEFDHHSGVFLTNQEPAKYHIHTITRTPNGNDYGRCLIEKFREEGT